MSKAAEAARIVASSATVSDKIRALDAAGFPRAEIARLLDKRYQHVRNVLEGDKVGRGQTLQPGVAEEPATFEHGVPNAGLPVDMPIRLEVGPGGRVHLPARVLEALGVREGSTIVSHLEGDSLRMISSRQAARRFKASFQAFAPKGGPSLADELIADRRREAEREGRES